MMAPEPMLFGPGFWAPIIATAAMLLVAAAGGLILLGGRRLTKAKPSAEKLKTYACGEELEAGDIHADSEQFFSPLRRVLGPLYSFIRGIHTGDLSTYLFWVVLGIIVALISIALAIGVG
ncbi:MAG: hypothetical protein ACE5OT_03285 [Candidatus Hadarchaeaceae archaeon]